MTLEGHHGVENSKDDSPTHHGLDGLFGLVMDWGLENDGMFSIEAAVGPVLVWGEADHFYGAVHHEEGEEEEHAAHDTDFKRTDFRGLLKFKYAPNDRLSFSLDTKPYFVTRNQGEEKEGTKNEIGAKALYEFGEGDVNFALGDSFADLIDGTYVSLEHRQGWDSEGTWQGEYTDTRLGVGFDVDLLSIRLEGGPRFFNPRSNAELSNRTDFAGELEVSRPIGEKVEFFFHWQPSFTEKDGDEWSEAWNHHVGTGLTYRF
tara:strand:- start:10129 stop:10908 length:780 start_codon:yes stop_codon:yes gene_type:complete